ncbi:flagellar biosynthesis anti-sigma factor FlgM [Paraburkholderia bonniea]|uniref:flagellar biosynthesis anti-sigma factor FlgM n=1 Tax=Paraburkholderia bonniea TaxID=2152891 RepID=UPI001292588C|nr:flagellar biosynthesis anti-sigma factor FlgM [Paraburkholderia bonniea]WJF90434.1 flagellar biosynthesis anti-sigma factor FlgM [Paraburkholderia bonniea]WJF93749.1 flagellar biosynthesis anti-sigma factor FlgM [Paraburkholderia bonniea]
MNIDPTLETTAPSLKDSPAPARAPAIANPTGSQASATSSHASSTAASPRSNGGPDASVHLSELSAQLRSLAASGAADIDTAHVAAIKQAIQDGTLQINPSKIADGVLETARALLQDTPSTSR